MQTTRLTSIGSRVEIATLMLARTVTSKNPSARPGNTCFTWAHCFERLGELAGRLAQVVGVLVPDPHREERAEEHEQRQHPQLDPQELARR